MDTSNIPVSAQKRQRRPSNCWNLTVDAQTLKLQGNRSGKIMFTV